MEPMVAEGAIDVRLAPAAMRASLACMADVGHGAVLLWVIFDRNDYAADTQLAALGKEGAAVSSVPICQLVNWCAAVLW